MKSVRVKNFFIGIGHPLVLISGPCVIEDETHALHTAERLKEITSSLKIPLIYKSSYDKANRSSIHSFRGPGIEEGLRILAKIKQEFDIPVLTDVHAPAEVASVADVCDVLQVPAFLCRQTDLICAAGASKAVVNVKKGQFMAPWDMQNVVEKLLSVGKEEILLTDRGTTFGYNNLVADMRAIPLMQTWGFPVCFDATHAVQLPGGHGHSSGGQREFIPVLARAAIAAGANCLFLESHPDPHNAKSDKDSVIHLQDLSLLLEDLLQIYAIIHSPK